MIEDETCINLCRFVNSVFSSNSYVVFKEGKGLIIDIGDFEPIETFIKENGIELEALLITHTHYDHIYGIREFMTNYPHLPIYTSEFGKQAFNKSNWNFSRYHEDELCITSDRIIALNDGEVMPCLENQSIKAILTPGHDKSCVSYLISDYLFSGDSYIPDVKVIASFPNSNKEDARYWYARLKDLSANMILCPGHGDVVDNLCSP